MSFEKLAESLVTAGFASFGEPVTFTPRSGSAIPATGIINREAEVNDEYGMLIEHRIEVELLISEVGEVDRGSTVLDAGSTTYRLLEPISVNDRVSRWTASEA